MLSLIAMLWVDQYCPLVLLSTGAAALVIVIIGLLVHKRAARHLAKQLRTASLGNSSHRENPALKPDGGVVAVYSGSFYPLVKPLAMRQAVTVDTVARRQLYLQTRARRDSIGRVMRTS